MSINREILRLAVPAIVSNITTPLLGLVDTAITGHLGAAVYLAAIAVGSTMFSMVYWLMAFLRMGSSGMTAQAYGARDYASAQSVLRHAMTIALVVSVAMILLSPWLSDLLLWIMDAEESTTELARTYFLIVIWGAPAVLCTYALTGWMLGMQDSKAPMWMALTTNLVNIAVSLVLVYGFSLKIEGVATGTVTAQWAGLGVGYVLYRRIVRRNRDRFLSSADSKPDPGVGISKFFKINTDIFLRTLCLVAVTVWFTRAGARIGNDILAANALLMQLFILFSYFMDGFAFAGEALAGKYYGAGDSQQLRATVRGVFLWGAAVVVLFTCVYSVAGEIILKILTDDYGVLESAEAFLPWAVAIPVSGVMAFVWDGIFIGMTLTRQMLYAMVGAMVAFFVAYWLLTPLIGNHGLWLAFVLYLLMRGVIQTVIYRHRNV